ncbi:MAG TPA: WGR domain-containing protein [Oleiagrimonas sp.]|nr:WGR domain-containing protein [Oleiagrimonas sp.]
MRIYMQTKPASGEAPRYVQLVLQQDLLGSWTLYRETGTEGGRATLRKELYLDRDSALAAFEQARDRQVKRGYQVMITQGMESPHGS